MAFPYTFEENFELGTFGQFNSETDTASILDFPHYSELARTPGLAMPWHGAYAMRIVLSGGTTAAFITDTTGFVAAANATFHCRLMIWLSSDFTMADSDLVQILNIRNGSAVTEASLFLEYSTANGLRWAWGETGNSNATPAIRGKWTSLELHCEVDEGVGNDGSIELLVDGVSAGSATGLDQAAFADGQLGVIGPDAGTSGTILIDHIITDTAEIGAPKDRFNHTTRITRSGHLFVGPGRLHNVTLIDGGSGDSTVTLYDTDLAETTDDGNAKAILQSTANSEIVDPAGMPVDFTRGCYVSLAGTNPQAILQVNRAVAYGSDGAIRNYALRR